MPVVAQVYDSSSVLQQLLACSPSWFGVIILNHHPPTHMLGQQFLQNLNNGIPMSCCCADPVYNLSNGPLFSNNRLRL